MVSCREKYVGRHNKCNQKKTKTAFLAWPLWFPIIIHQIDNFFFPFGAREDTMRVTRQVTSWLIWGEQFWPETSVKSICCLPSNFFPRLLNNLCMDPVSDWILLPYWSLDTDHSFCSICSVQHVRPLGHICSCEPEKKKRYEKKKLSPKIEFQYVYP